MAEAKWIKITTDMFNNRKIKYLRTLPEGNNIVLVWVMLLTLAGRCNAGGMIFLTENIPYTTKMLADELEFEESTIVLALQSLKMLGMIQERDDGQFFISGWSEHQNVDGLEKIKEQTRKRVAKHREKQKQISCNVTSNVTVTECNATDIDIDKEEDKEYIYTLSQCSTKGEREGTFQPPTLEEVKEQCGVLGMTVEAEPFYDFYTSKGWKVGSEPMKDWKASLRGWIRNHREEREKKNNSNAFHNFTQRSDDLTDLEKKLDKQFAEEAYNGLLHSSKESE